MFGSFRPEKQFSQELYEKSLFSHVLKDDIAAFLGEKPSPKVKKPELVEKLKARFEEDPLAKRRYYKEFRDELAIGGFDVENLLACSKTERTRWTKEEKLPVVRYDTFKYGDFPLYDRWFIEHLPEEEIAAWRAEHDAEVAAHRAGAAAKAQKTRQANADKRASFKKELASMIKGWYKEGFAKGAMMELAYWTMWANRWAKLCEMRMRCAKQERTREKYADGKDAWYEKKNEAIKVLSASGFCRLSFYRPESPDKVSVYFCEEHFEQFRDARSYGMFDNVMQAYWFDPQLYDRCPACHVEKERDYYSLYFLEIGDKDCTFSFHTPFPIGKTFLPSKKAIPRVEQDEDEGMFRFGRPLSPDEVVTHTEKLTLKKFDEALEKAKKYVDQDFRFDTLGVDDEEQEEIQRAESESKPFETVRAREHKITKPKIKIPAKKNTPKPKKASGHAVAIEMREGKGADEGIVSGYCIIDGESGSIVPFSENFAKDKNELMNDWNRLRGGEREACWTLLKCRTNEGHRVKLLSVNKASEGLRSIGDERDLSKFHFVLLDAETGKFVRGYQDSKWYKAVRRWKNEHSRKTDSAIKKWVFSRKGFCDALLSASADEESRGEVLRIPTFEKLLEKFPEERGALPVPVQRFLKWLHRYEINRHISMKALDEKNNG